MRNDWHIPREWAYLGMFICFILICVGPVREYWSLSAENERIAVSKLPPVNAEKLLARGVKLRKLLESPARNDPMDYYKTVGKVNRGQREHFDYERQAAAWSSDHVIKLRAVFGMIHLGITKMQVAYWDRHGRDGMYELAKLHRSTIDRWTGAPRREKSYVSYASFWQEMGKAYFFSVVLALIFFCFRLKDNDCKVLLESWRIIPIAAAWPGTVFFYPHRVNPKEQARQILAFCMYALTFIFSLAGAGVAKAAGGETKAGGGSNGKKIVQTVGDDVSSVGIALTNNTWSEYRVGIGKRPHSHPVNQTTLTVSHKPSGLFAEIFVSTDFSDEENGGREVDWTIGWSGKYFGAGIAYFDLAPLMDREGGDIANVYGEASYPWNLTSTITIKPGAKFEFMGVTSDTRDLSDWVGTGSLGITWTPHKRVSISERTRVVYDGGVFGGDHGVLLRFDVAVNWQITDHLSLALPQAKRFEPIDGLHDRDAATVFGMGFSYAH